MREQIYSFTWNEQPINLAYTEWGEAANPRVLVCVHGLTRNSRDFDFIAAALANDYRILCLDMIGRGRSSWVANKMDYNIGTYAQHISGFLDHLGIAQVDWIGTSMGGLTGMMINALCPGILRKFIVNDIGPFIPKPSLERIAIYAGNKPKFIHLEHAKGYFQKNYSSFGITNDLHWQHLAKYSTRAEGDGLVLHYDPGIVEPFKAAAEKGDLELWPLWEMVACPTLIVRGRNSDVLPTDILSKMLQKGAFVEYVEVENTGHAPSLMDERQIGVIKNWLQK